MMLQCEDWRRLSTADVEPLLTAEAGAWRARLGWEVSESWRVIEPARAAGQLPGFVLRSAEGRLRGWTCFVVHRGCLQVAAFVADSPEATAALLDSILRSADAGRASTFTVCVRDAAPGLRRAVAARGFDVTTYRYLRAPLTATAADDPAGRLWQAGDADPVARLCSRAYAGSRDVRAFAPRGTPDEWQDYIRTLVTTGGCGRLMPDASLVVPSQFAGRLDAVVITTSLGPGTAHIAQVSVDPIARGRGLGGRLVRTAMASAAASGCDQMTLLVAQANAPAAATYSKLGFQDHAEFVVAINRQPRRFSSVALVTGGASTRR